MNQRYKEKYTLIEYFLLFAVIVALWMPVSYSYILPTLVYSIMRWGQYIVTFGSVFFVIVTGKSNRIFILNVVLSAVLIFSTVINGGNINKCFNYIAPMLGTVSVITYSMGIGRTKQMLQVMRHVLTVYILINIATYFLFPKGLYISELINRYVGKPNTFLGNRNTYKFYGILIILVSYLEGFLDGRKNIRNGKMIIAFGLALTMELLGESLTGIIIIVSVVVYYFMGEKIIRIRKLDPKKFFWVAVSVFIFLVVFIVAGKYTNILAYIFSGNITLSNRVRIWLEAEKLIQSNPVLGIGTLSSENIYSLLRNYHAHNQFLEIALRGGVIAVAIYMAIIWTGFKKLASFRTYEITTFVSVCIFLILIIDMVECETYSYAVLSYSTAIAYCWRYPANYAEEIVKRKRRVILRIVSR